ncbi:MAG: hypothetical protein ACQEUH_12805 [Pseudomonadota bacterium]
MAIMSPFLVLRRRVRKLQLIYNQFQPSEPSRMAWSEDDRKLVLFKQKIEFQETLFLSAPVNGAVGFVASAEKEPIFNTIQTTGQRNAQILAAELQGCSVMTGTPGLGPACRDVKFWH